ncbi:hypothetical protein ACFL1Q_03215 [Patescibacteria group bacterium]
MADSRKTEQEEGLHVVKGETRKAGESVHELDEKSRETGVDLPVDGDSFSKSGDKT